MPVVELLQSLVDEGYEIESTDPIEATNREVEVVLLPPSDDQPPVSPALEEDDNPPNPMSSEEKLIERPGQFRDTMQQLADAQDRALRSELHYAFEVERRKGLEARITRLESFHSVAPTEEAAEGEEEEQREGSRPPNLHREQTTPDPEPRPTPVEPQTPPKMEPAPQTWIPIPEWQAEPASDPKQQTPPKESPS